MRLYTALFCIGITMSVSAEEPDRFRKRIQINQLQEERNQLLRAIGAPDTASAKRKVHFLDNLLAQLNAKNARQASFNALQMRNEIILLTNRQKRLDQTIAQLNGKNKQLEDTLQTIITAKHKNNEQHEALQTLLEAIPAKLE